MLPLSIFFLIILPLSSFIYIGLAGRFLGRNGLFWFAIANLTVIWLIFAYVWYCSSIQGISGEFTLITLLRTPIDFDVNFLVDSLGVRMSFIVLVISTCVILYSFDYLENDPHLPRFISYLFLFVFCMMVITFSGNLFQFFFGWEGVGLTSFLLVNFWFTRLEANRSAVKAVLFNRVGDIALMCGMVLLLFKATTLDFLIINNLDWLAEPLASKETDIEIIMGLIFIGAMAKSAQLGLHAWLPDAMEGPTPVSALLHSATMVTVGIFMMLRLAPVFNMCENLMPIVTVVGSLTAIMAGLIAFFQSDIKKIIAYSTCSQLGLMVTSFGIFNFEGCFFHLTTHAFFKALLFLAAGCVIHALLNEQDIRKMGGLIRYMPVTAICMAIGIMGLIGFPFFSGFYSKEFILFSVWNTPGLVAKFAFINIFFASCLTILYSCKMFYLVFLSKYRGYYSILKYVGDSATLTNTILCTLAGCTIFFAWFFKDTYIGMGNVTWEDLFPIKKDYIDQYIKIELTCSFLKVIFVIITFIIGYVYFNFIDSIHLFFQKCVEKYTVFYFKYLNESSNSRGERVEHYLFILFRILYFLYCFGVMKFWFNSIYKLLIDTYYKIAYHILLVRVDRGLLEEYGMFFIFKLIKSQTRFFTKFIFSFGTNLTFILIFLAFSTSLIAGVELSFLIGFFVLCLVLKVL